MMAQSVFSTQQSKFTNDKYTLREQVGLRGLVMATEIRVELAEMYMDAAKIDLKAIQQ